MHEIESIEFDCVCVCMTKKSEFLCLNNITKERQYVFTLAKFIQLFLYFKVLWLQLMFSEIFFPNFSMCVSCRIYRKGKKSLWQRTNSKTESTGKTLTFIIRRRMTKIKRRPDKMLVRSTDIRFTWINLVKRKSSKKTIFFAK